MPRRDRAEIGRIRDAAVRRIDDDRQRRVKRLRDEAREAFVERDGVAVERQYFLSGSSPRVSDVCFIK
ncbi:hypothetical protein ACGYU2_26610 [Burkholderia pseudomallei]